MACFTSLAKEMSCFCGTAASAPMQHNIANAITIRLAIIESVFHNRRGPQGRALAAM
ncbi:MAG: hypothetical protein JWO95_3430 [Verrucomicrobiales bacterium]|nr:hypothetical protein [Verrucomicrobiales bacterium]